MHEKTFLKAFLVLLYELIFYCLSELPQVVSIWRVFLHYGISQTLIYFSFISFHVETKPKGNCWFFVIKIKIL